MSRVLRWVAAWWCVLAATAVLGAELYTVSHELWDRPRSARAVLEQPAVKQTLEKHLAQPASRLVIHHALGQDTLLQAEELRMWLMALAIDGSRISLVSDLKQNDPLKIEVAK